jgi:hypothetical protein
VVIDPWYSILQREECAPPAVSGKELLPVPWWKQTRENKSIGFIITMNSFFANPIEAV